MMERLKGWLITSDIAMFQWMNRRLRCRPLDSTLPVITHLGGAVFTLTSLALFILLARGQYRIWAFEALASLALSHIFVQLIKRTSRRNRPFLTLSNVHLAVNPLRDYSFPSGHTTAAFSIAVVLALHSALLAAILLPIAVLVSFSRMYLGLHYPSDCLIGILLGTISSFIVVFSSPYLF